MILQVNRNPSLRELRQFGAVMLIGFGLLGGLSLWMGREGLAWGAFALAAVIGLWGLLSPTTVKPVYRAWMGLAVILGTITSWIVMTFLFFVIITPVALVFKLIGRDALHLKRKPRFTSYWSAHPPRPGKAGYEHLF